MSKASPVASPAPPILRGHRSAAVSRCRPSSSSETTTTNSRPGRWQGQQCLLTLSVIIQDDADGDGEAATVFCRAVLCPQHSRRGCRGQRNKTTSWSSYNDDELLVYKRTTSWSSYDDDELRVDKEDDKLIVPLRWQTDRRQEGQRAIRPLITIV